MQHIWTTTRPRLILAAALTALLTVGGLVPWRVVAQSGASALPPPATSHPEATREKNIQKERADIDAKDAQLDARIAQTRASLSPVQLKAVQPEIDSLNAFEEKQQQRTHLLEQGRADYAATHPNRLSDEQIAFVRHFDWFQWKPTRIRANIRRERIIKQKLQASLASTRDTRSRRHDKQQIVAIDQRRQQGEEQIRDWQPIIDRDRERIALLPAGQWDRVTKLDSYDLDITVNKLVALMEKQIWVRHLRQKVSAQEKALAQPRHASAASSIIAPGGAAPLLHGAQSARGGTEATQPNHPTSAPVRVSPVMARALDKQIARLEKQQRVNSLNARPKGVAAEGVVIAFLKARREGAAWAQASITSRQFSRGLTGQQIENLRRTEQEAQQNEAVAKKYVFLLAVKLTAQENLCRLTLLQNQQFRRMKKSAAPHALPSSHTANLYCFAFKGQRVRVFTKDGTGQHLILDKVSDGGVIEPPPVPVTNGNVSAFFMYDNGKLVKAGMPELKRRRVLAPRSK